MCIYMSSWIKDSEELWVTEADVWVASVSEITKKYLFATLRSHTCIGSSARFDCDSAGEAARDSIQCFTRRAAGRAT